MIRRSKIIKVQDCGLGSKEAFEETAIARAYTLGRPQILRFIIRIFLKSCIQWLLKSWRGNSNVSEAYLRLSTKIAMVPNAGERLHSIQYIHFDAAWRSESRKTNAKKLPKMRLMLLLC